MSPMESKIMIDKFDGTNYRLWAYKMEMHLKAKGLWDHVTEAVTHDNDKNGKAQALIVLALSDQQLLHCIGAKSAKDAWIRLKAVNDRGLTM